MTRPYNPDSPPISHSCSPFLPSLLTPSPIAAPILASIPAPLIAPIPSAPIFPSLLPSPLTFLLPSPFPFPALPHSLAVFPTLWIQLRISIRMGAGNSPQGEGELQLFNDLEGREGVQA